MNGKAVDGAAARGTLGVLKTHFVRLLRPGPVAALLIWQGGAFGLIPVFRPAAKAQSLPIAVEPDLSHLAVKSLSLPLGLPLFADLSFALGPGDRIVLIAANGRCKSSLLRCLAGQLEPTGGDVSLLAEAGSRADLQTRPLPPLSGGQKARLALLLLWLAQPNFYRLDAPTNHLDIEGQEALECALLKQGATCLLVSHDRQFVRNLGTRFWLIDGKKLVEEAGPERFLAGDLGV